MRRGRGRRLVALAARPLIVDGTQHLRQPAGLADICQREFPYLRLALAGDLARLVLVDRFRDRLQHETLRRGLEVILAVEPLGDRSVEHLGVEYLADARQLGADRIGRAEA